MKTKFLSLGFLLITLPCFAASHYVDANGANPTPPYSTWQTAAATIQDAVDVAAPGDEILVTNGIYAVGGRAIHGTMTNRVAVDKPVRVLSLNGPQVTTIQGYQVPGTTNGDAAIRCVYLTNGAFLAGFTLTGGATRATNDYVLNNESCGGGLLSEPSVSGKPSAMASNCVIFGNSAYVRGGGVHRGSLVNCLILNNTAQGGGGVSSVTASRCVISSNTAGYGGGAAYNELGNYCVLNNCLLIGNRAAIGGGASACFMTNCTITANSAGEGGGVYGMLVTMSHRISHAYNCIVYGNTTESGTNMNYGGVACSFDSSCTAPMPEWGNGNISNDPLFVDAARGDYRLRSGSSCINTGSNSYVAEELDLDGLPRILGGTVDMGAYETLPGLIATRSGASLRISWPLWASEFVLQETQPSASTMEWTDVASPPTTQDGAKVVTVPVESARLFRLKKQ